MYHNKVKDYVEEIALYKEAVEVLEIELQETENKLKNSKQLESDCRKQLDMTLSELQTSKKQFDDIKGEFTYFQEKSKQLEENEKKTKSELENLIEQNQSFKDENDKLKIELENFKAWNFLQNEHTAVKIELRTLEEKKKYIEDKFIEKENELENIKGLYNKLQGECGKAESNHLTSNQQNENICTGLNIGKSKLSLQTKQDCKVKKKKYTKTNTLNNNLIAKELHKINTKLCSKNENSYIIRKANDQTKIERKILTKISHLDEKLRHGYFRNSKNLVCLDEEESESNILNKLNKLEQKIENEEQNHLKILKLLKKQNNSKIMDNFKNFDIKVQVLSKIFGKIYDIDFVAGGKDISENYLLDILENFCTKMETKRVSNNQVLKRFDNGESKADCFTEVLKIIEEKSGLGVKMFKEFTYFKNVLKNKREKEINAVKTLEMIKKRLESNINKERDILERLKSQSIVLKEVDVNDLEHEDENSQHIPSGASEIDTREKELLKEMEGHMAIANEVQSLLEKIKTEIVNKDILLKLFTKIENQYQNNDVHSNSIVSEDIEKQQNIIPDDVDILQAHANIDNKNSCFKSGPSQAELAVGPSSERFSTFRENNKELLLKRQLSSWCHENDESDDDMTAQELIEQWQEKVQCSVCTFINDDLLSECEMCGSALKKKSTFSCD